jgi:hypothetical protein
MPPLPRVYADFNAIEYVVAGTGYARLPLTGYGTLASLSRQRLRLTEGRPLILFEPNDIECEATAHFETSRLDPAGRLGEWVALIQKDEFRDSRGDEELSLQHPCFGCGVDLNNQVPPGWRTYKEFCSACGTPVMAPLLPPSAA